MSMVLWVIVLGKNKMMFYTYCISIMSFEGGCINWIMYIQWPMISMKQIQYQSSRIRASPNLI